MNEQECRRYLERIQNLGIKFGLDNVREVLHAFQDPHRKFSSVLVAGSNGKGSVCAFLARIVGLHGLRAGLFTSPHLVEVEERVRVGETLIPRRTFCRILTDLKSVIEKLIAAKKLLNPPTYFEHLTCLAFLYFAEQDVDIAFCEVGMGGRFDATNVVEPEVSVITTISAEHQKFLGEKMSQIAYEKSGIIKPGVPVVCGVQNEEAYATVKSRAEELGAPFCGVFDEANRFREKKQGGRYVFSIQMNGETYTYEPSLLGKHQGRNAAVAIAASLALGRSWKKLDKDKILRGIQTTLWEGRLEVLSQKPLVLLDGAHNEEGAEALRDYLVGSGLSPVVLLYASMRGKKIERIAETLFPLTKAVILTQFPYHRAYSVEELAETLSSYGSKVICEKDAGRALRVAEKLAGLDGTVLVAGSLFLVGEVKKKIQGCEPA